MNAVLPDFIIIGAMKSGTTSLYDDLKRSASFDLPDDKEPGVLTISHSDYEVLSRYRAHFGTRSDSRIRGEASTYYTMQPLFPDVSQRAYRVCGRTLKLIAILRNPLERTISHLRHDRAVGRLKHSDFNRALDEDPRYIQVSDYVSQLRPWVERFGVDQLLCLSFADYVSDRKNTLRRVANFLGANPDCVESRQDISNPSTNLRSAPNRHLVRLLNTELYRRRLRKLIPKHARAIGQRLLTTESDEFNVVLSAERISSLLERFAGMEDELAILVGTRVSLSALLPSSDSTWELTGDR